jgi:hypothetical protein
MASRSNVRTHTRKTASGGTTTVRQHQRRGRPRRGLVTPGHAWGLAKRAFRAARRKKRATAAVLGVLAAVEITAWLTLEGTSLMLATAGLLALGVAAIAAAAGGVNV